MLNVIIMSLLRQITIMLVMMIIAIVAPSYYFSTVLGITGSELVFAYSMVLIFIGGFFILAILIIIKSRLYS